MTSHLSYRINRAKRRKLFCLVPLFHEKKVEMKVEEKVEMEVEKELPDTNWGRAPMEWEPTNIDTQITRKRKRKREDDNDIQPPKKLPKKMVAQSKTNIQEYFYLMQLSYELPNTANKKGLMICKTTYITQGYNI